MKRKKQKNRLDEMQEQKLLQIEHNGCWLAFWGLIIAIFVQLFVYGQEGGKIIRGEWIVFMCLAVYIVVGCLKHGIWDRSFSPTPKTNLIWSMVAGIVGGVIRAAITYRDYHMIVGAIAAGIFIFFIIFASCFIGLTICAALYHKKVDKLENEEAENSYNEMKDEELK